MTQSIIKPSPYPDGTYQRTSPRVVKTIILDLSNTESRAVHQGRRSCSCDATELVGLGERCMGVAREVSALSWSIYPLPNTHIGVPKVIVEFHNWPEMGMCNFQTPIAQKRYWWDVRPVPQWITGDERGEKDKDGQFDVEA